MYIVLLLFAWFMLRFAYVQYNVSSPTGLFYSDLGDYVTAFMYQPLFNIFLIFFVVTSLGIIYTSLYLILHKIIHHMTMRRAIIAVQLALTIYLAVIGFLYFEMPSLVFLLITLYFIIQDFIKYRRKRIRRIHF